MCKKKIAKIPINTRRSTPEDSYIELLNYEKTALLPLRSLKSLARRESRINLYSFPILANLMSTFALDPERCIKSKGRIEMASTQNQNAMYYIAIFFLSVSTIWVFGS